MKRIYMKIYMFLFCPKLARKQGKITQEDLDWAYAQIN